MITKFDINQFVFYMARNKIESEKITQITIRENDIRYALENGWTFDEDEIFDSLENILSHLRNKAQFAQKS